MNTMALDTITKIIKLMYVAMHIDSKCYLLAMYLSI